MMNPNRRQNESFIKDDFKDYISTITELSNETESPKMVKTTTQDFTAQAGRVNAATANVINYKSTFYSWLTAPAKKPNNNWKLPKIASIPQFGI